MANKELAGKIAFWPDLCGKPRVSRQCRQKRFSKIFNNIKGLQLLKSLIKNEYPNLSEDRLFFT
jgi:hypothetical protein